MTVKDANGRLMKSGNPELISMWKALGYEDISEVKPVKKPTRKRKAKPIQE